MPSQFRIPKATIDGAYGALMTRVAKRMWGQVPDNAHVLWHNKPVLKAVFGFEQKVGRWKALDPHLKAYAEMASAGVIGCSWCLDFGYFLAHTKGLDEAKVREVPRWRESDVFTGLEREVMAYAEAMTVTPPEVTDEMVASLDRQLGHALPRTRQGGPRLSLPLRVDQLQPEQLARRGEADDDVRAGVRRGARGLPADRHVSRHEPVRLRLGQLGGHRLRPRVVRPDLDGAAVRGPAEAP